MIDRDLFIKEFFAYYEDSELGRWLVKQGRGETIYWPRSVVQHYHSSTLSEGSATWRALTRRSNIIYKETHPINRSRSQFRLNLIDGQLASARELALSEGADKTLLSVIKELDMGFLNVLKHQRSQSSICQRDVIGIFNLYWNTRGEAKVMRLQ